MLRHLVGFAASAGALSTASQHLDEVFKIQADLDFSKNLEVNGLTLTSASGDSVVKHVAEVERVQEAHREEKLSIARAAATNRAAKVPLPAEEGILPLGMDDLVEIFGLKGDRSSSKKNFQCPTAEWAKGCNHRREAWT